MGGVGGCAGFGGLKVEGFRVEVFRTGACVT